MTEANKQGRAAVQILQRDRILSNETSRGTVLVLVLLAVVCGMRRLDLNDLTVPEQHEQGSPALLIKL